MMPTLYLIEMTVADLERSLAWYTAWLGIGAAVVDRAGGFAMFEPEGVRLSLKQGTPLAGTTLFTFEVDDLDAELVRLAGLGIAPDGPIKSSDEGYRRARFRDPDGQALSLFGWTSEPEA